MHVVATSIFRNGLIIIHAFWVSMWTSQSQVQEKLNVFVIQCKRLLYLNCQLVISWENRRNGENLLPIKDTS